MASGLRRLAALGASLALLVLAPVARGASPPQLYSVLANQNRGTEGPVRGDPGDVLLLPGTGFTLPRGNVVVYAAVADTTQPPARPSSVPTSQTATLGVISPLAVDANAVTVLLPAVMTAGQAYALWVAGPAGWSNPALINDARPMWMLPGPLAPEHGSSPYPYAYSTADRPGTGRVVTIYGRNLSPVPGRTTLVTFVDPGGTAHPGSVAGGGDPRARYAVEVTLPASLPLSGGAAANYTVKVSRDGVSWVSLGTPLTVLPDPPAGNFGPPGGQSCPTADKAPWFFPEDFGGCNPCDTADDTACVVKAIAAARQYSAAKSTPGRIVSGSVVFGGACANPTWMIAASPKDVGAGLWGIEVPVGVNLVADPCAAQQPILRTGQAFDEPHLRSVMAANAGCSGIPDVTPCTQNSDCCPQTSLAERCVISAVGAECQGAGTPCTADAQCCSASCAGGVCAIGGSQQCQAAGTACTADAQCCSTSCTPGACVDEQCVGTGAACADDSQCSGVCAMGKCEHRPPDNRQHLFQLDGANVVQGLHIQDTYTTSYKTSRWAGDPIASYESPGQEGVLIRGNDVVLTGNFFDNTFNGVRVHPASKLPDGASGAMDVVIRNNRFSAWEEAVNLGFCQDSVVDGNTFWPGSFLETIGGSALGAQRLDVSRNTLDGTVRAWSGPYLGFRAGFFFPSGTSQEDILVSGNRIACVGTRPYQDGEAIITDSNGDPYTGFRSGERVLAADGTHVTVRWPGSATPTFVARPALYGGRWLQVSAGTGLGQARKIASAQVQGSAITFTVSPPFDVVPAAGTANVLVGNLAWQMYIVGNTIDDGCSRSLDLAALHPGNAGVVSLFGSAADSVIEGNTQTDAAGINIDSAYVDWTGRDAPYAYHTDKYFIEIRGNSISSAFGGQRNASDGFGSGIDLRSNSTVMVGGRVVENPNVPGFGVSVSHNTIVGAALARLGTHAGQSAAIALAPVQQGSQSSSPGYLDTLVFANDIRGTPVTAARTFPWTSAISNGANANMPNYPANTVVCTNRYASFPAPGYSDWPDERQPTSLIVCAAGCASGATTDVFGSGMVGCGGAVTWDQRAALCGTGYAVCTVAQWSANRGAAAPTQDYWTSADPNNATRVCTPGAADSFGNTCASPTAGTLCCPTP